MEIWSRLISSVILEMSKETYAASSFDFAQLGLSLSKSRSQLSHSTLSLSKGKELTQSKMLSKDYIVGLVDGEGSFTAYVRNLKESTEKVRRVRVEPRFYLKLIEKDKKVLVALKNYFQCGNVYFQKDNRKNHQHCYRYEVSNRKDLETIIIPFFKKNRLCFPSKQYDFQIFCKIMNAIKRGEHLTDVGLRNLYQLKQLMH